MPAFSGKPTIAQQMLRLPDIDDFREFQQLAQTKDNTMPTNQDIKDQFEIINNQLFRKGANKHVTAEFVTVRSNGLAFAVAAAFIIEVLKGLVKCPGACENGKVWIGGGYTPCPTCGRNDEMKMPPRTAKKRKGGE